MQADEHADAGRAEAPVPADALAEEAGDERRDERADVDAHVEDREAGVAPRAAFRIQIADDRRDVRLEQPGAEDDEDEAEEERHWPREHRRERDREVAERDEHAARPDRAPQPEPAVGDPAAGQRREVDAGGVDADDGRRLSARSKPKPPSRERGRHEQDEQRAEPVVREPLPHLGEEERRRGRAGGRRSRGRS